MITMLLDDRLFLAPLGDDVDKVLDVGTGTGIWAMYVSCRSFFPPSYHLSCLPTRSIPCSDFADQFPASTVIGTDLSPIQPGWIPPNVRFEIDDAQLEWTYPASHFDFIHIRCLMGSIMDWPELFRQAHQYVLREISTSSSFPSSLTTIAPTKAA
jgi:hypothetical protein